ncbi:MAG: DUF3078 domain-containing protein [Hymenobacteraceae bacterium]|nr:DUF3078 domain-containing protein [Hymenobacteraceae bacterium]MDX5396955.1 DUF3078 domain-containing protein [Hymenobacteraceae bacterium]MDX5443515.1 DUF3078 domain-containing protein [Hymenobacteraceae bacterium]MDX5513029.1 DUF3078 domain-containing protein [Hymenobacteraceae bacterium]
MKYTFTVILSALFFYTSSAFAQTDTTRSSGPWDWGGAGTLNFNQVNLTNWAPGGENSIAILGITSLFANYKKGENTWNNSLNVNYGLLRTGQTRIRKSDDRINAVLKYGHNASTDWYYTAQLDFRSQLTPTYDREQDSLVSKFMSPGFLLASVGMDYKPNENFSIFISPLTGKFTFVTEQSLADAGAFGVEPARKNEAGVPIPGTGENFRKELGAFINAKLKREIFKNITLQSKLDLFSNYLEKPENIDVNWENLIDMKVNKYVSVSVFTHLIYDDDIDVAVDRNDDGEPDGKGPRVQFKETLGVGLSYKF